MSKLLIIGCGGHGKVVCDVAENYYGEIVFADDNKKGEKILSYRVKYSVQEALDSEKCDFIVAVGDNDARERLFYKFLERGFNPVSLVSPNAYIGQEVEIGVGSVVFAGAVINPCTKIGIGCIINTSASVDHDSYLGDFTHVCPGVHMAGTVKVGKGCFIGVGSTVINNITISDGVFLGAGSLVVKNIEKSGKYFGVPAKIKD